MTDFIDKRKLLMNIADNQFANAGIDRQEEYDFWQAVFELVEAFPTVDLEGRLQKKAPIWKEGQGVVHYDHADGSAHTEINKWADWVCPECGWFVGEQYVPRRHNQTKSNYCSRCGQAIDWEAVDKKGAKT